MPTSQAKHTPGLLEALRSADATLARIDEIARRHFDAGRGEFDGYWGPVAAGAQHERRRIAAAVAQATGEPRCYLCRTLVAPGDTHCDPCAEASLEALRASSTTDQEAPHA